MSSLHLTIWEVKKEEKDDSASIDVKSTSRQGRCDPAPSQAIPKHYTRLYTQSKPLDCTNEDLCGSGDKYLIAIVRYLLGGCTEGGVVEWEKHFSGVEMLQLAKPWVEQTKTGIHQHKKFCHVVSVTKKFLYYCICIVSLTLKNVPIRVCASTTFTDGQVFYKLNGIWYHALCSSTDPENVRQSNISIQVWTMQTLL